MTRLDLYRAHAHLPPRMMRAKFKIALSRRCADDVIAAGRIGMWIATGTYDPRIGPFAQYASAQIYWHMRRELHHHGPMVRRDSLATNWFTSEADAPLSDYSVAGTVGPMAPDTSEWLLRGLTATQRQALEHTVIVGRSMSEAARELGVTKQAIDTARRRGLRAMRARLAMEAA